MSFEQMILPTVAANQQQNNQQPARKIIRWSAAEDLDIPESQLLTFDEPVMPQDEVFHQLHRDDDTHWFSVGKHPPPSLPPPPLARRGRGGGDRTAAFAA